MKFTLVNNMQRNVCSTADLTALQWQSGKGSTDCLCLLTGWLSHCKIIYKVSCWARKMQLMSMQFVYHHRCNICTHFCYMPRTLVLTSQCVIYWICSVMPFQQLVQGSQPWGIPHQGEFCICKGGFCLQDFV